jgi:hypothetical protein
MRPTSLAHRDRGAAGSESTDEEEEREPTACVFLGFMVGGAVRAAGQGPTFTISRSSGP